MHNTSKEGYADMKYLGTAFLKDQNKRLLWKPFYDFAHSVPLIDLGRLQWIIGGYDDVVSIMGNEAAGLTVAFPVTQSPVLNELFLSLLPHEPSDSHRRLRSLVQPLFSVAKMSKLESQISALLESSLYPDVFDAKGCDVLSTLGLRLPVMTSCILLDIPQADWERVGQWASLIYKQIGRYDQPDDEVRESELAYQEFEKYLWDRTKKINNKVHGGIGEALIDLWRRGELNDKQLIAYFALFLFTGLDTLTHAIGNSLWFLGNNPDVFAALRQDPTLSEFAFDETMRLWGPIRLVVRQIETELKFSAGTLPESASAFLLIHAANRDERRFPNPDQFKWNRQPRSYLAFGVGPHGCLGIALSRMIGSLLFRSLARNCLSLRATPGHDDINFISSLPILGIESVKLFAEPNQP